MPIDPSVDPICVRRGNQWLDRDELEAHLAALVRLENVGVLLGAGSSMGPLGGMTMAALWKHFSTSYPASKDWLGNEGFIHSTRIPNIESLTDDLEITRAEWERTGRSRKLKLLNKVRGDIQRSVIRGALLKEDWWKAPASVDLTKTELSAHRKLLQRLTAARQPGQSSPWIFTTNYDLAIEWAAETIGLKVCNGFEGLHNRTFSPHNFDLGYRNTLARGEARFGTYNIYLAKLHGSLSWQQADHGSYLEYSTAYLWPPLEQFLNGRADGSVWPLVFPSAAKYLQTVVGFVLGELLRRFTEFLSRPQSCLISCGYSFADSHLNEILIRALQNPTLQLVIYLPEVACSGDTLDLSRCQSWVRHVLGLESPQVTIVGGGADAYFSQFAEHLPDPAIYDEQAAKIKEMLKEYKNSKGSTVI